MYGHVADYLNEQMQEGEKLEYSFYVAQLPSFKDYIFKQYSAVFDTQHLIITLTNKRLLVNGMNHLGKMTGEWLEMEREAISSIKVKRGFFKSTVIFTLKGEEQIEELVFKPNNICIGMPYHKESLKEMAKQFG